MSAQTNLSDSNQSTGLLVVAGKKEEREKETSKLTGADLTGKLVRMMTFDRFLLVKRWSEKENKHVSLERKENQIIQTK